MKNKIIFICIVFSGLCSCNPVKRGVSGIWNIENMVYKGKYIDVRYDLFNSSISFKDDMKCILPYFSEELNLSLNVDSREEFGEWEMIKKDKKNYLRINTRNSLMRGMYAVRFKIDQENKLLEMQLTSDDTKLICKKWLSNYSQQKVFFDELVELTNEE